MTTLEVLRTARKRIENPENWFQGHYGSFGGSPTCLVGHVCIAKGYTIGSRDGGEINEWAEICALGAQLGTDYNLGALFDFNDTHTHAEVIALLDTVIAKLEEQEYGAPLPELIVELETAA